MEAVSPAATLTADDIKRHEALRIPAELLAQAKVRRVSDRLAREVLSITGKSGDYAGIEYPYIDPIGGHRVSSRVRLDHHPHKSDGTPEGKYRAPYGDNRHLYFPPGAAAHLNDPSVNVVVVEAEKSALAITAAATRARRSVLVVACGGCWNWRGRVGKTEDASGTRVDVKGPLSDFGLVSWARRTAFVLFDAKPNDSVKAARRALGRELMKRGANVLHAHLPDDDRSVNGPDDLIGTRSDDALWGVLDEARPEDFRRDGKCIVIAKDIDNIRLALRKLGVTLGYDAFARQVLIDHAPADDTTVNNLWVNISDTYGFRADRETLHTVLSYEAHEAGFHPVCDYLSALTWDGRPRLDEWLITYAGAERSNYVRAVSALPMIAAVRRVRAPGVKFDELLVLESAQGTLKSSALRALCPDESWFSDDLPLGVDSKHVIERTAGKWIIEAAEMHGNRGREAEQIKAFLSRQVDGPARLAYARLPTSVPRQFVMIGTTNGAAYLKDSTGARRFWPVRVQRFDVAALQLDRDQLWAEAAAREEQAASIRLPRELWQEAGAEQEQRTVSDPWEDALDPLLDTDENAIAVNAIWDALRLEASKQDNRHADRVAAIMHRRGFTRKEKIRRAGKPAWHWVRGPSTLVVDEDKAAA